jgi:hypothetical protein
MLVLYLVIEPIKTHQFMVIPSMANQWSGFLFIGVSRTGPFELPINFN